MKAFKRAFCSSIARRSDFSHVVIGGGVVGTAVAAELQKVPGNLVALVEQHEMLGMETTSRNSEVIHAGLYYPPDSLKAKFCVRGKNWIYKNLDPEVVPYKQCGKWIVAQSESELEYLDKLKRTAEALDVPVSFVSPAKAKQTLPMIRAEFGALESPTTGIISAHDLTLYFHAMFENSEGTVAINTRVDGIEYEREIPRYRLTCTEMGSNEPFVITADNLVNSAGLHAQKVANMVLPKERHFVSYFAKGNYYSFAPENPIPTAKIATKLIYPCPQANASGLGTHLTFDLGGQLRFGPDLEWVDEKIQNANDLNYDVVAKNLTGAHQAIASYFPSIALEDIQPSYAGFRPKLLSKEQNKNSFADFYVQEEHGYPGFVNLIGIESPGLTSSPAIAEYVRNIYHG